MTKKAKDQTIEGTEAGGDALVAAAEEKDQAAADQTEGSDHPPHPPFSEDRDQGPQAEQGGAPSYIVLVKNRCFGRLVIPEAMMNNMNAYVWHAMLGYGFVIRCEYVRAIPGYEITALSEYFEPVPAGGMIPEYISEFDTTKGTVTYRKV